MNEDTGIPKILMPVRHLLRNNALAAAIRRVTSERESGSNYAAHGSSPVPSPREKE